MEKVFINIYVTQGDDKVSTSVELIETAFTPEEIRIGLKAFAQSLGKKKE